MRDSIADQEALTFIQTLAQALASRMPIDQAVAVARQQLLTIYKFNQPAWTLPVLYMHPEFDGQLLSDIEQGITQLPEDTISGVIQPLTAKLRSVSTPVKVWQWQDKLVRVGRHLENDIVIDELWVSLRHAQIFCRQSSLGGTTFFLRDKSRFGTLVLDSELLGSDEWQTIHQEEVQLKSGMRLKFGSSRGEPFEFIVEG